jgi:hypothetical protein
MSNGRVDAWACMSLGKRHRDDTVLPENDFVASLRIQPATQRPAPNDSALHPIQIKTNDFGAMENIQLVFACRTMLIGTTNCWQREGFEHPHWK